MTGPTSPPSQVRAGGAVLIIVATAIAGLAGYGVTVLAFRELGAAPYALFAVFWAALYLVVGGLSGIQQELTRATHPIERGTRSRPSRARNFALVGGAGLFVLIVATSPLWDNIVFASHGPQLVLPLAVGAASYVIVATLAGSLYGVSQWRSIFLMIVCDGVLRLVLVLVVTALTHDLVAIAWAVAIPFPAVILLLWRHIRVDFVGRSDVDVEYRSLSWNVARTVFASISTAVLVSGFPLILGIAGKSASAAYVGELIFAITIARAPLIVTVGSLQSIFVVRFRDRSMSLWRTLGAALGLLVVAGVLLSALAWWLGPPVLAWIEGGRSEISGALIAVLVASSALIALITVSGSAVLSRSQHLVYSLGWGLAAIVTIAVMALPIDLTQRVEFALVAAPIVGLAVHLGWLAGHRRQPGYLHPAPGGSADG